MTALLRAELLKLRTTRTFAALVGTAAALSVALVALAASLGDIDEPHALFTNSAVTYFIVLLGAIGITGEWRHRTITSTVLAAPDRLRLLAAKTLSYSIAGVVLSLLVTAATMLVGTLILSGRGEATLDAAGLADVLCSPSPPCSARSASASARCCATRSSPSSGRSSWPSRSSRRSSTRPRRSVDSARCSARPAASSAAPTPPRTGCWRPVSRSRCWSPGPPPPFLAAAARLRGRDLV